MEGSSRFCAGRTLADGDLCRFRQLYDGIKRGRVKKSNLKRKFVKALVDEGETNQFAEVICLFVMPIVCSVVRVVASFRKFSNS